MKLDVFISVLNEKKERSSRSTRVDLGNLNRAVADALGEQGLSPEIESELARGPAYHVELSSTQDPPRAMEVLAEKVQQQNESLKTRGWTSEKPISLSAQLPKPPVNFDQFLKQLAKNASLAAQAHLDFDRKSLMQLFES